VIDRPAGGPERNRIEPKVDAMRRRDFVALIAATLAMKSIKALAQTSTRRPLIAVLLGGSQTRTAKALGLRVPASVPARADKIIE
jgi:hypothetical protein